MALTRIGTRGRVLCPGRMCSHLRLTMLPAFAITAPCVLLHEFGVKPEANTPQTPHMTHSATPSRL